jgi:hypothetical protein
MVTFAEALYTIQHGGLTNDELTRVIDAVKYARSANARKAANTLRLGQRVSFNGRNGLVIGTLEQIKIKKAIVNTGVQRWNVPLAMLEAA